MAIFTGKFWVKELMLGQTNILLGVLLICALAAAQRDRWRPAAVLVGLGTFVKPYAILLFPWFAIVGGLQAVLVSSTVLALGLVVPAAVYGWQGNMALLVRLASHGHGDHGAESPVSRKHLAGDNVGEMARTGSAGLGDWS